jgi:MFS family permease
VEHQLKENHHHRGYDPQKTKHYLEWLAQNLKREKTTEFLLENMQPSWLELHRKKWYRIAIGIIIWLIMVLVSGLVGGLIGGVIDVRITGGVIDIRITGVLLGIILGLTNGLLIGGSIFVYHTVVRPPLIDEITPYEVFDLKLSLIGLSQSIYSIIFLTILILIFGSAIGLVMGLMISLVYGLISGLMLGLMAGIMLSLITVLHGRLRSRDKPNQGIWNSGKNGIIITVFSFPFTFAAGLIISLDPNNPSSLGFLSVFTMTPTFSLLLGIYSGGGVAFIQHFVLRYFLIRAGHIPRDYVGFLQYAEERGLILQNGGSFRFYHDLLREHLAGNP